MIRLEDLRRVNLDGNLLSSWSDVDAIASWCPKLQGLSLAENPLMQEEHSSELATARIRSLEMLDGSRVGRWSSTDRSYRAPLISASAPRLLRWNDKIRSYFISRSSRNQCLGAMIPGACANTRDGLSCVKVRQRRVVIGID